MGREEEREGKKVNEVFLASFILVKRERERENEMKREREKNEMKERMG